MRFQDKVAIVTGGASGIGKACVELLAAEGAKVAIADLNEEAAKQVAEAITAAGGQGLAVKVDVGNVASVRAMVDAVVAAYGTVDILINNAGWDKIGPFINTDEAFWDKIFSINLKGQLAAAHAVLPHMLAKGYGKIVNVASDAGRNGSLGETPYASAKGGVIAFTKSLAREVTRKGVNVNCICPGLTDTALLASVTEGNDKLIAGIVKAIPVGRVGRADEVAKAMLFMASDDASYITGQTLSVSGGLTMM